MCTEARCFVDCRSDHPLSDKELLALFDDLDTDHSGYVFSISNRIENCACRIHLYSWSIRYFVRQSTFVGGIQGRIGKERLWKWVHQGISQSYCFLSTIIFPSVSFKYLPKSLLSTVHTIFGRYFVEGSRTRINLNCTLIMIQIAPFWISN